MKIVNNVNYQTTNLSKNRQNNNNFRQVSMPRMANDSVSFTGLNNIFKLKKSKQADAWVRDIIYYAPSIINKSSEEIEHNLNGKSVMQKRFFAGLVDNFNRNNFGKHDNKRENPDLIFNIVNKVKKPSESHLRLANSSS